MYYFRFQIPTNADGTRVSYSPGWCGTTAVAPKDPTILLYNDKDGYGIAKTEDTSVPKDVEMLDKEQVNKLLSQAINQLTAGDDWKPIFLASEILPKDAEYLCNTVEKRWSDAVKKLETKVSETIAVATNVSRATFCPICHLFIMWLPENLVAKTINLTCPKGHKVVLNG